MWGRDAAGAGADAGPAGAAGSAGAAFVRRRRARAILVVTLAVALVGIAVASTCVGQYEIPVRSLPRLVAVGPLHATDMDASVVWRIRLPRLVLGLFVGAALGVGGALMQAVFANPLAEPSVIGVTSGAGVGAALVIVSGVTALGTSTVPVAAFLFGMATTVLVYTLARWNGQIRVVNLILVGIAVNAVAGAMISFMIFFAPTTSREQIIFWQMGTLSGARWAHVGVVGTIVMLGVCGALLIMKQLDLLALGERAATHVGINVPRLRAVAIVLATLLTAGAVSYAGLIGFVGLVIPHIVRTVAGPSNVILVPASALGGAALIGAADVFSRTVIPFADLPIGIFTALVGGPTFFYLLRRMMKKGVAR
ncbi:FecCD family ABC transporter permease [Corynebacterium pyruviciproducens]|uniref:FecCD family ABC transporter permease n=1 Tax=Corynebacterium pyruviciproducens TaxID=598660 RepID=UPI00254C6683|nr:iron ABC transporter permease [Corynebacterium pyruviciproducens]MDK7214304.1 iron ABC transporter permease [Corynebacterium pyruviciproducens]